MTDAALGPHDARCLVPSRAMAREDALPTVTLEVLIDFRSHLRVNRQTSRRFGGRICDRRLLSAVRRCWWRFESRLLCPGKQRESSLWILLQIGLYSAGSLLSLINSQNTTSLSTAACCWTSGCGAGCATGCGAGASTFAASTTGPVSEEESHGVCLLPLSASTLARTLRCASSIEMPGFLSSSTNAKAYGEFAPSPSAATSPGAVE